MDNRPIGVMDSGLGGLTFVKEIRRQLPNESIVFLGDEARLPYGIRPAEEVCEFSYQIAKYLMHFDIKIFVIACNTATAAALPYLQKHLNIPVIGVIEPGSRAAEEVTKTGQIGVIATQKTIESAAYTKQIKKIGSNSKVVGLETQEFVTLVEENQMNTKHADEVITAKLAFFNNHPIDTLILGCTHFPLLTKEISGVVGKQVTLIDSGAETATIVKNELHVNNALADENNDNSLKLFTTGLIGKFQTVANDWLDEKDLDIQKITLGE